MAKEKKISIELTLTELDDLGEFLERAFSFCVDSRWMERAERAKVWRKSFRDIAVAFRKRRMAQKDDTKARQTDEP